MSQQQTFQHKVVWITGASSGIGEALALEFAAQGACLVLSARRQDVLASVKQRCLAAGANDEQVLVLPLDVTDEASLPDRVQQAKSINGRIDLLLNNAGVSQRSECIDTDMATYRALFDVDVFGQIALTKAVLPSMIEQSAGHIVVTSSVAGKVGVPFRTGYCAAKHAVMGFFDALRSEIAHHNIAVSTITPGFIQTDVSKNALAGDGSAFGKLDDNIAAGMPVDKCAQIILAGLANKKNEIAVGQGLEMHTLWLKRLFPNLVAKLLQREYVKRAKSGQFK